MPRNDKNQAFFGDEIVENHAFCCAKNVENHAIFVEGFWPDFYARGRFMKYSMSVVLFRLNLSWSVTYITKGSNPKRKCHKLWKKSIIFLTPPP